MGKRLTFLSAIFLALCAPFVVLADGGNYDNRYYVTDEMWATEPYNKFVYFEGPWWDCSAQYIAPNLILTAGHCASYNATAKNYKKEKIKLQLVYNRHKEKDFGIEDWAVFLVKNHKYYSDTFFEPEKIRQQTDMLHAGWGWVRILTDDEINTIMNLLESVTGEESNHMSVDEIGKALKAEMKKNNIEQFRDKKNRLKASRCHSIDMEYCDELKKKEKQYREEYDDAMRKNNSCIHKCQQEILNSGAKYDNIYKICEPECREFEKQENDCYDKWMEIHDELFFNCYLNEYENYPNIIGHTCTAWQGDSGGGFVSEVNDKIYGVCSFHSGDGFSPTRYMASAWQFDEKIKKLRDIYSTSNSDKENVKKAKENTKRVRKLLESGVKLEDLDVYDVITKSPESTSDAVDESEEADEEEPTSQEIKQQMEMLSYEISQHESDVHEQIKNIKTLKWSEKLQLLDNIAAYEVKSEQLAELQKAYEEALARERSLPNRILSAAAIGATGIGGMMTASALAEQAADANAERTMRAYLETITCEYGDGKRVKNGETNIELPGGNDMIALYTEYATLANDLKMRKELLGLSPGIESEIAIDKSDTGLYDNVGIGITGGTYASIARAIQNPDGEDAKKWNLQKSETAEKLKTGASVAAAGAIGGVVGNALINGK